MDNELYMEDYDAGASFVDIMIDNARNEMAMFEAMIGIDLYESKLRMEGAVNENAIEALNEASGEGIISKIIEMVKSFFKKIGEIFRSFFKKKSTESKSVTEKARATYEDREKQDKAKIEKAGPGNTLPNINDLVIKTFEMLSFEEAAELWKDELSKFQDILSGTTCLGSNDKTLYSMDSKQIIEEMLGCKQEEYENKFINQCIGKQYEITIGELGGCKHILASVDSGHAMLFNVKHTTDMVLKYNKKNIDRLEDELRSTLKDGKVKHCGIWYDLSDVQKVQSALIQAATTIAKGIIKYYNEYIKICTDRFNQMMADKEHVIYPS